MPNPHRNRIPLPPCPIIDSDVSNCVCNWISIEITADSRLHFLIAEGWFCHIGYFNFYRASIGVLDWKIDSFYRVGYFRDIYIYTGYVGLFSIESRENCKFQFWWNQICPSIVPTKGNERKRYNRSFLVSIKLTLFFFINIDIRIIESDVTKFLWFIYQNKSSFLLLQLFKKKKQINRRKILDIRE